MSIVLRVGPDTFRGFMALQREKNPAMRFRISRPDPWSRVVISSYRGEPWRVFARVVLSIDRRHILTVTW